MELTFRWYGEYDKITLKNIAQIPCIKGVVSAVYDVPVGEIWSYKSINKIKEEAIKHGLKFEVVESIPVHEDIKMGKRRAQYFIDNYKENIKRLAESGVKCICYNFMPVFDWLRSDLNFLLKDGSSTLAYTHAKVLALDPNTNELSLPGWDASYKQDELLQLLKEYRLIDKETLWQNYENFLKQIIPIAEKYGVMMAVHPDDPPWDIFELPRIISSQEDIIRLLNIVDVKNNGITFCAGSLGVSKNNDLGNIISIAQGRIHFAHLRNIKRCGENDFYESGHYSENGDLDMYRLIKLLHKNGFKGFIRPDHGRMIWDESGKAGYGLYDRALGAMYLSGIIEAVKKQSEEVYE